MIEPSPISPVEFEELAIAHLLGELDPAGEAAFDAELSRRGAEGLALVRGFEETLGEVALAAAPTEPPRSLRARVLVSAGHLAELPVSPREPRSPWPWIAAGVLAVVAIGLGAVALRVAGERDRLRAAVDRLEARIAASDSARDRIADLGDFDLAGEPGSIVHDLIGTEALPRAGGRVFVDPVTGNALLLAHDLPVPGPDALYQLWAIGEEGPRAVGALRPDGQGRGRLEIRGGELLRAPQALAVTVEPAPGVAQPSGETVLSTTRP